MAQRLKRVAATAKLSQRRCPVAPPVHDSADRPVSTQCLTHSRSCAQGDVRHEGQPGCPASVPGRLVLPPKVLSQGLMVVHERLRKQHETLLLSLLWHGPSCSALLLLHLPVALCVAQHVPRCHWRAVYYGRSRKPCCCRSNTLVARPETQGLAELRRRRSGRSGARRDSSAENCKKGQQ